MLSFIPEANLFNPQEFIFELVFVETRLHSLSLILTYPFGQYKILEGMSKQVPATHSLVVGPRLDSVPTISATPAFSGLFPPHPLAVIPMMQNIEKLIPDFIAVFSDTLIIPCILPMSSSKSCRLDNAWMIL